MQSGTYSPGNHARMAMLDGLRGVAAISVLFFHANNLFPGLGVFARAYLFVDLFFMLSGFVLTLAIEGKLKNGLSWPQFMRLRWLRLWPIIMIGALVGAIPFAMANDAPTVGVNLLKAALLIPLFLAVSNPYPLNPPHWSLAMEIIANFLHAAVLWRLPTRALFGIAAIFAVVLAWQIQIQGVNNFQSQGFSWSLALSRVAFAYVLGMAIAREHSLRQLSRPGLGPIWVPLAVILTLPYLPYDKALTDSAVTLVVLPAIFIWATTTHLPQRFTRAATKLGAISYPLYAVHLPVLVLVADWRSDIPGLIIATIASLSLAWILAQLFERRHARIQREPAAQHLPT